MFTLSFCVFIFSTKIMIEAFMQEGYMVGPFEELGEALIDLYDVFDKVS